MAKVYVDQGNWDKAAEIYRYLLEREPERRDFIDALSALEGKQQEKKSERLSGLFRTWVELSLKYNRLQKLKKLQGHLGDS
jgi:hypothetical protein